MTTPSKPIWNSEVDVEIVSRPSILKESPDELIEGSGAWSSSNLPFEIARKSLENTDTQLEMKLKRESPTPVVTVKEQDNDDVGHEPF